MTEKYEELARRFNISIGENYPRDMVGYGSHPPTVSWPADAYIAVNFVINYEEGGEQSVLDGDESSEVFLSEIASNIAYSDRHKSMESLYEYGSRVGWWRLVSIFERHNIPATVFGVAVALLRNPQVVQSIKDLGWDVVNHGYRWLHYQEIPADVEAEHIANSTTILTELFGAAPQGWYTGRDSPNTRRLVVEQGGYSYDCDSYADDVPYWVTVPVHKTSPPPVLPNTSIWSAGISDHYETQPESSADLAAATASSVEHLVIPYSLDTNDMKYASPAGFAAGPDFYAHIRDAFDILYAEGKHGQPKMLSIGLHCRIAGRPARAAALDRLISHIRSHDHVWITGRNAIASLWKTHHSSAVKKEQ